MPPAKFTVVHWGSRLTDKDRETILHWVKTTRAAYYATGLAAEKRANEPIQPLPSHLAVNVKKAALGEKLFNDKRLSADGTLACSGCHLYEKAGTDNSPLLGRHTQAVRRHQRAHHVQCGVQRPSVLGRPRRGSAGAGGRSAAESH